MIINNQTNPYQLLSPALGKSGKSISKNNATATTDDLQSGTDELQLSPSAEQLAVSENNLTAAIPDMDAAKASVKFLSKNIISQPNLAMAAQANSLPSDALRLLQD